MAPTDKSVRQWDIVTFLALLFGRRDAGGGRLPRRQHGRALVRERTIDLVFISDICLQFFIGYKDASRGNVFINDRVLIAKRYMRSWFWIDCVSTFPIDVVAARRGRAVLEQFGAMRLLKLLKLGRIGRVKRMMERWEVYAVFAVSYAEMSMYKSTVLLIIYAHWTACLWGVIAHPMLMGDNAWTWKDAYTISMTDAHGGRHFDKGARHSYLASLYMAVYTMTGIGYGDITPTNQAESAMITTVMIMSAVFWAFMIGNFCSLVSTMNVRVHVPHAHGQLEFDDDGPQVPDGAAAPLPHVPPQLKQHQRMATYSDIENYFSLSLRGEVAATSNEEWIKKVWYLRNSSKDFIIELSQSLGTMMFAPMEAINVAYTLFILQAGIAARKGRILSKGSVWGADFIVRDTDLIDRTCAASLSYTMVLCIGREHILEILENDSFDLEYVEIVKARTSTASRRSCGGGDGSPARPAPERKPSKRTMLNRMSVTKLPRASCRPRAPRRRASRGGRRTSIPEFDALLYDDDDDDGDGDGAGRNSMDLTEYMPRSFARLERALHQLDRDRRSSSLSAVHRQRPT
ncbi:voltage-gated potassium channel [Aureococcus anophagefferens]|nr:voltage-gated potassium channel [Aureococcus anophagefferens]